MKKIVIFILVLAFSLVIAANVAFACSWDEVYPVQGDTPYQIQVNGGGNCQIMLGEYLDPIQSNK